MIGFVISGGVILMIYSSLGWQYSIWILVGTLLSYIQLLGFKEPDWGIGYHTGQASLRRLRTIWKQPGSRNWLTMLLLFPAGITIAYALIAPILVDMHWSLQRIGLIVNVAESVVGVLSALFTGWIISRFGRNKTVLYCTAAQMVSTLSIGVLAASYNAIPIVGLAISLHYFGYTSAMTLLCTLITDHSSTQTPSTDYTLQYSFLSAFQPRHGSSQCFRRTTYRHSVGSGFSRTVTTNMST